MTVRRGKMKKICRTTWSRNAHCQPGGCRAESSLPRVGKKRKRGWDSAMPCRSIFSDDGRGTQEQAGAFSIGIRFTVTSTTSFTPNGDIPVLQSLSPKVLLFAVTNHSVHHCLFDVDTVSKKSCRGQFSDLSLVPVTWRFQRLPTNFPTCKENIRWF